MSENFSSVDAYLPISCPQLLRVEPSERMTLEDAAMHPWLQQASEEEAAKAAAAAASSCPSPRAHV